MWRSNAMLFMFGGWCLKTDSVIHILGVHIKLTVGDMAYFSCNRGNIYILSLRHYIKFQRIRPHAIVSVTFRAWLDFVQRWCVMFDGFQFIVTSVTFNFNTFSIIQ